MRSNSSYQHDENAETRYLAELISTYGSPSNLKAASAIKTIYARWAALENKRGLISETLESVDGYRYLCLAIHRFIYGNILSNAGQFRSENDPNGGRVYFGGTNHRTMKDKFTGTEPKYIEAELVEAFQSLFDELGDPVERSIRFYVEFVAIHPFYDANGRIGRYIVDTFLQKHNCYVDWQSINEKHRKFLRKLNYCHSVRVKYKQSLGSNFKDSSFSINYWQSTKEKYIGYLLSFWRRFVIYIEDLEND